jgi:hypothetical protein
MTQGVNEQIGVLPAIEAKLHLFQVGRKMLGANPVPRSHDAALEERESGFNRIGVNVSHHVHARTVVNLFVICPLGFPHSRFVRGGIIRENDFHVLTDILADVPSECSALCVSGVEEAQIAVALADAYDHFFVVHASDTAFALVPSADVRNVHLDLPIQHRFIGLRHGVADAMAEIPRRLVAHSDRALNLASGHALLRFAEQVRSKKPLAERQVRIIEHGAGSYRELIITVFAIEELLVGIQLDHWPLAAQAFRAIGPAETDEKLAALIIGCKKSVYIN